MAKKRGQARTSAAASLVGIIALLIVFYIIFLPTEERRELLLEDAQDAERLPGQRDAENLTTLLLANIGTLERQPRTDYEHTIPNVQLAETRNAQEIEKFNPFIIRNSWFVKDFETLTFTIADPELISNAQLVLDAPARKGTLIVRLNNRVVFEGKPGVLNIPPIPLRRDQLQRDNTLELEVSGVGIAFWSTNAYEFSNAQVIADITDIGRQQSTNIVNLEQVEVSNLQRATLTFFPVCDQGSVGPLDAYLNGQKISSSVPDCESANRIELDPNSLSVGRNSIGFQITKGNYRIEQIRLRTELKEARTFLQFFDLNKTRYEDVARGRKDLTLRINFVDDGEDKRAELNINGRRDFIDQDEPTFTRDLKNFAVEGNNYIEIIPKTSLNIVKLEVILD